MNTEAVISYYTSIANSNDLPAWHTLSASSQAALTAQIRTIHHDLPFRFVAPVAAATPASVVDYASAAE